ncbi:MAG: hypothetical protein IJ270_05200 [Paludibacteraceae bacterium]|nr:hypothetical protein [Paludibacteraceae bacterium]
MKKFIAIAIPLILLILVGVGYFKFYFVFGEGVKSGELNYVVKKGIIFKTYEGKLIQSGVKSSGSGSIQSNEFIFSVEDEKIAEQLMVNSGKEIQLYYREYYGKLPWRGYSNYIVDSIISIKEPVGNKGIEELMYIEQ